MLCVFFVASLDLLGALKGRRVVECCEGGTVRVTIVVGGGHQRKRHQMLGIIKVFNDQGHLNIAYNLDLLGRHNFPALARYIISPVVSGAMATSTTRYVFVRERGDISQPISFIISHNISLNPFISLLPLMFVSK
jgi:ribulose kinase